MRRIRVCLTLMLTASSLVITAPSLARAQGAYDASAVQPGNRDAAADREEPSNRAAGNDSEAIRQTALDYIEGWYEGNPERMQRALHPDLAKRIVNTTPEGRSQLDHMGATTLVDGTRQGFGKKTPREKQLKDVKILDLFENAASVRVDAADWVDYLHIARVDGEWKIVNVLWEWRPEARAAQQR
jgi:hypothetical protein